jgi:hypothetical protein
MRPSALAFSAATLIALAAPVAQAASYHHARHYYGPYAYRGYGPYNAGGPSSPGPIYRQGYYLGTDPDPNVRFEITRDPYFGRK